MDAKRPENIEPTPVDRQVDGKRNRKRPKDLAAARRKRLTAAALNAALAQKRCRHCGSVGAWGVYGNERTAGRVRYVRCLGCRNCSQIPVIVHNGQEGESDVTKR